MGKCLRIKQACDGQVILNHIDTNHKISYVASQLLKGLIPDNSFDAKVIKRRALCDISTHFKYYSSGEDNPSR